jgi:ethanolamine utilization cobalamin adenosyltransferase
MVITEAELRELWRDGKNPLPPFPPGTRFSPAAQDFLKTHTLEIRFESFPTSNLQLPTSKPEWDRPAAFPVVLTGPAPVCAVCGQPLPPSGKPDHMTQLDAGRLAAKTHPRIKLRGRLDTLHALIMLVAAEARRYQLPRLAEHLDTLAAYCREIQSAEYHGRTAQPLAVAGKSEDEIHEISHWPDKYLGIAHLTPGPDDHAILHWMNYVRTKTREAEVAALETYPPPERADLSRALNRLSSTVYYLELLFEAGNLSWQVNVADELRR